MTRIVKKYRRIVGRGEYRLTDRTDPTERSGAYPVEPWQEALYGLRRLIDGRFIPAAALPTASRRNGAGKKESTGTSLHYPLPALQPEYKQAQGRATPTQLKLLRAKTHGRPAPTAQWREIKRFVLQCRCSLSTKGASYESPAQSEGRSPNGGLG